MLSELEGLVVPARADHLTQEGCLRLLAIEAARGYQYSPRFSQSAGRRDAIAAFAHYRHSREVVMETRHVRVQARGNVLEIEWSTVGGAQLSSRTVSRDHVLRDPDATLLGADADWPMHLRGTPIVVEIEDDALRDALDAHPKFRARIKVPGGLVDAVSKHAVTLPSYGGEIDTRGFSDSSIEPFNATSGGDKGESKGKGWTNNS